MEERVLFPSMFLKKKFGKKIMNIHIQDPKVSLDNFDFVVIPEHDGINGRNVITSKGAIHYLRNEELDQNINYLKSKINKEKGVTLIVGGPNRYYDYHEKILKRYITKLMKILLIKVFN